MDNERIETVRDGAAERGISLSALLRNLREQGNIGADVKATGVYEMLADAGLVERVMDEAGKKTWQVTELGRERGISQRPPIDGRGSYPVYDELGVRTVAELLAADADGSAYAAARERAAAAAQPAKPRFPESIDDANALCRRGERFVPDFVDRAAPLIGRDLSAGPDLDDLPSMSSLYDRDHGRQALLLCARTPYFKAGYYGRDKRGRALEKKNSPFRTVSLDANQLRRAHATYPDSDLYVYVRWECLAMGGRRVEPLEGVWVASLADLEDKVDQGLLAHSGPVADKVREGESRDIYLISLLDPVFTELWSRRGEDVLVPLELDTLVEESTLAPRVRLIAEASMERLRDALFEGWEVLEKGMKELPCDEKCVIAPDFSSNEEGNQDKVKYDKSLSRLYYFLRYGYGYAYEYYLMWRDLLDDMDRQNLGKEKLDVLSLGCGNGIDLWALRSLLAERGESDRLTGYVGVDIADWSDLCFPLPEGEGYRYRWGCGAADYLRSEEAREHTHPCARVIVLPKSLGEMNEDEIEGIGESIFQYNEYCWHYLCVCPPHGYKDREGIWDNDPAMRESVSLLLKHVGLNVGVDDALRGEKHRADRRISQLTDEGWWGHLSSDDEDCLKRMLGEELPPCCQHHGTTTCAWKEREKKSRCPIEKSPILRGWFPCYRIYYLDGRC